MASVFFTGASPSSIDYSIVDGRVRSFMLRGVKLYDEQDGTAADGWRDQLVGFVLEVGLDLAGEASGREHAFVTKMRADGLLRD